MEPHSRNLELSMRLGEVAAGNVNQMVSLIDSLSAPCSGEEEL
jgi:hypothetical protein